MPRPKGSKNKKASKKIKEEEPAPEPTTTTTTSNVLKCRNPWKHGDHNEKEDATDIKLFITYKDENLPICQSCWLKIADSDHEWGDSPKLDLSKMEVNEAEVEIS